jgi:hypothetical protein
MKNPLSYGSTESALVIGRILERLATGPADTKELIAATHRTGPRARGYISHLADAGRIYCMVEQVRIAGSGSTAAVWALNPECTEAPVLPAAAGDAIDDFQRCVIVRQQWAPNHVRMPLVAALFGVPKILQGTHA